MKKIIGLGIVLLTVFTYIAVNSFSLYISMPQSGYVIGSESIYESVEKFNDLEIESVSQDDEIYERNSKLYLNKTSFNFNESYPLILDDLMVAYFFDESASLLADDFHQMSSFKGMYLDEGISFNSDLTQADTEDYILVRLYDKTYMNAQLMKVSTSSKDTYVSNNSFIIFTSNEIYYQSILDDGTVYSNRITGLSNATISIGSNEYTYEKFYSYLLQSEADSSFSIDDDRVGYDATMPRVTPLNIGEAKLKEEKINNKIIVNFDVTTVSLENQDVGKEIVETNTGKNDNKLTEEHEEDVIEGESRQSSVSDVETGKEDDKEDEEEEIEISIPDGKAKSETGTEGEESEGSGVSSQSDIIVFKCENFTPWVYTAGSSVVIYDGGNRIIGNVSFTIKDSDGNTLGRKSASSTGEIVLTNLRPDSDLTITASYRYKDLDGLKKETGKNGIPVAFQQTIHTLSLSEVGAIGVSYTQSDNLYANQVELESLMLTNPEAYDESGLTKFEISKKSITSYISKMSIICTRKSDSKEFVINIPNNTLSKLKAGETVDYISTASLDSMGTYDYKIVLKDVFGNTLKTDPVSITGTFKTLKITPTVSFKLMNNEAGSITVKHVLNDEDNALISDETSGMKYKYRIKNDDGLYVPVRAIQTFDDGSTDVQTGDTLEYDDDVCNLTFTNLPYNNYLTIEIIGDIDINDGLGTKNDVIVGTFSFYSKGIVSGSIAYNTSFDKVAGTYATINIKVGYGSSTRLTQLMSDLKITILSDTDSKVRTYNLDKEVIEAFAVDSDSFVYKNGGVTIQEGDERTGSPQIRMIGAEEVFTENIWQSFLKGAESTTDYATLEITFPQQSLSPSTTYSVNIESLIDQGLSFYNIDTSNKNNIFSTLKREPIVHWSDYLIVNNNINLYDVYIEDVDGTIVQDPIICELYKDGIIYASEIVYNGETNKKNVFFEDLMDDQEYTLRFKATAYNNGGQTTTNAYDYVFYQTTMTSNSYINGSLDVGTLERTAVYTYTGDIETYAQKNLLSDEFNLMKQDYVQEQIKSGYNSSYNGVDSANGNYFTTGYIALNPDLEKTLLIRNFASTAYYGNYETGGYYSGYFNTYLTLYEYNETKNTYTRLGYITAKMAGDYVDLRTLSYANRITHVRLNGFYGYDDVAELYQGIEPLNVIDNDDYGEEYREPESYVNSYGQFEINSGMTIISYPFTVHPGDIYFTENIGSGIYDIGFYDSDGNAIQVNNYYSAGRYLGYKVPEGDIFVIPNNCTTMKVSWYTSAINNPTYYIKQLSTSEDVYYSTIDVSIEDKAGVFTEPTKYILKSKVGTDTYEPSNKDKLVKFIDDIEIEFYNDEMDFNEWLYSHDITLELNTYYYFELYLSTNGYEILLDTAEIYTDNDWEYIYSWADFDKIMNNPLGQYKVMADIVMPAKDNYNNISVEGTLDFNGHKFYPAENYYGIDVGPYGVVENCIVVNNYPGSTTGEISRGAAFYSNYGTIRNIIVMYNRAITITTYNDQYAGFLYYNQPAGVVENVAVLLSEDITINDYSTSERYATLGIYNNKGTLRNSYFVSLNDKKILVQNTDEETTHGKTRFGTVCYYNFDTGVIENCYSTIEVWQRSGNGLSVWASNFVNTQYYGGVTRNCFSVGDRKTFTMYESLVIEGNVKTNEYIPSLTRVSSSIVENSYYFVDSDNDYSALSQYGYTQGDSKNLLSEDWYTGTLGFEEGTYLIRDCIELGYYPRLNFPSFMAAYQPFVSITSYARSDDSLRVIDTQITTQKNIYAEGKIFIYNPDMKTISDIKIEYLNVNIQDISHDPSTNITTVSIRVASPTRYYSSYKITSIGYKTGKVTTYFNTSSYFDCEFYRNISSVSDWTTYVINDPTQNYRLKSDIDFNNITIEKEIYVSKNFTGKLDGMQYDTDGTPTGECYSLKNIKLGSTYYCVINRLYGGTVSNLIIDNLTITPSSMKTGGNRTGFIGYSDKYGSVINNVSVINSRFDCCYRFGAIVAQASYIEMTNCSAVDCEFYDYLPTTSYNDSVMCGAICGYMYYSDLRNCFAADNTINIANVKSIYSVGGLIGYIERCKLDSIYTTGTIYNYSSNTGGIIGKTYNSVVSNGYSYMTIEGSDIIGGITGLDGNTNATNKYSSTKYENLITFSNIYCKNENYTAIHRLFGTANNYGTNVYAYENQIVSPVLDDDMENKDDAKRLIRNEELVYPSLYQYEVCMGDQFDYNCITQSSVIPQLYYTDSTTLLMNQPNIYISLDGVEVVVEDAYKDTDLSSTYGENVYTAKIAVNHPSGYTVYSSNVNLNDMKLIEASNAIEIDRTNPEVTHITVRTTIEKALDSYTCNLVLESYGLKNNDSYGKINDFKQNISVSVSYSRTGAIYWEISNFSDWQEIMRKHGYTNENFLITGAVDFSKADPLTMDYNLVVNKIDGNDDAVLKNLTITATSSDAYTTLISSVTSGISNVKFENIKLDMQNVTSSVTNFGLVSQIATVNNVSVDGFQLIYSNNSWSSNVGFFGLVKGNVTDFSANDIYIQCLNKKTNWARYIGTIGTLYGSLTRCDFNNIEIKCSDESYNEYVGGVCGYANPSCLTYQPIDDAETSTTEYSFKISNSKVTGYQNVGGAIGVGYSNQYENVYRTLNNVFVDNVEVHGCYYVGGLCGYGYPCQYNIRLNNSKITGDNYVGGMYGYAGSLSVYHSYMDNNTVEGIYCTGGYAGNGYPYLHGLQMSNCNIKGYKIVGGLIGESNYGYLSDFVSYNNTVTGISKDIDSFNAHEVAALSKAGYLPDGSCVGGVVGSQNTVNYSQETIRFNIEQLDVSGTYNVGGLFGQARSNYVYYGSADVTVNGDSNVGGITGKLLSGPQNYIPKLQRFYIKAEVTGDDNVGGVAGYVQYLPTEEGETLKVYGYRPNDDYSTITNNYSFCIALNVSLKCASNNVDYFATSYQDADEGSKAITAYAGAIDNIVYLDSSEMSKNGGSFVKISEATLPVMYNYMDTSTVYKTPAEIVSADDFVNYAFLYNNRTHGGMNLNASITMYDPDAVVTDYPFEITKTANNTIEIGGLTADQSYDIELEFDNDLSDEDLLLYYDAKNNTGNGSVDTSSTVWKNLGSLGSDYDMTIYTTNTDGKKRYSWTDGAFHVIANRYDSDGAATSAFSQTYLTSDPDKGTLKQTDTSEYTISITYSYDYLYESWVHLFGTYINYSNWSPTNRVGPTLYAYLTSRYNRKIYYSGRWDNDWVGYDNSDNTSLTGSNRTFGDFFTLTAVYSVNEDNSESNYAHHTVTFYLNGQKIAEKDTSDYYYYMYDLDETDGWIHMLCYPKKTYNSETGQYEITYSPSTFAGDIYSAKLYGHALSDAEVYQMYSDDYTYYVGKGNTDAKIVTLKNKTADANGNIVISNLTSDKNILLPTYSGNLKVTINNNSAYLNYVTLNDQVYGLKVYDASTSTLKRIDNTTKGYKYSGIPVVLDTGVDPTTNATMWYRSTTNSYYGELIAEDCQQLYVNMSGYYYAFVGNQYTSIIHIDNESFYPHIRSEFGFYPVINSEGTDYLGNYNSVKDKLQNGGTTLSGFVHNMVGLVMTSLNMTRNVISEELPDINVYASGVDTLAIELDKDTDSAINVTITTDDGLEVVDTTIYDRLLTVVYDYQSNFTISWSDGTNTSSKTYKVTDIRNTVSTYGDHYYYLTNNSIETDTVSYDKNAAHIYNNEAILANRDILNLDTGNIRSIGTIWNITANVPLYTFTNDDSIVYSYYSYSDVYDLNGTYKERINGQVIIKGNENYTLTPDVSEDSSGVIVDKYNNAYYLSVLNEGQLVDLYDTTKKPEEFTNTNIKEISSTVNYNGHIVLVRYENGTICGFDYLTGEEIELISTTNESFLDYLSAQLTSLVPMTTTTSSLQGSYKFAAGQINALTSSYDDSVLSLFAGYADDDATGGTNGNGEGNNNNELEKSEEVSTESGNSSEAINNAINILGNGKSVVTKANVHGTDVTIEYNDEEGRFVIKELSNDNKDIADANTSKSSTSSDKDNEDDKSLQEKIDELAETNTILNLSKGVIRNTKNNNANTSMNIVFGLIIISIVSISFILLRRGRKA